MRIAIVAIILFCMTACTAQMVSYTPIMIQDRQEAIKNIERLLYEQHKDRKVQNVVVTDDYLEIVYGVLTHEKGVASQIPLGSTNLVVGKSSEISSISFDRVYFEAMDGPFLYKKRDWYIIQVVGPNGKLIRNLYTEDFEQAKRFLESIEYFKKQLTSRSSGPRDAAA